jgi:hypothetical protein
MKPDAALLYVPCAGAPDKWKRQPSSFRRASSQARGGKRYRDFAASLLTKLAIPHAPVSNAAYEKNRSDHQTL